MDQPTRGFRLLTAVVLGLSLLAGCADGGTSADPPAGKTSSPAGSASPEPSPTPTIAPADPDHAVDPPPPFKAPLRGDDMLIYGRDALSDDMIERIRAIRGVAATEHFSLSNVSVNNRAIAVAAVDPASYRNWTPQPTAQAQEVWQRVAGGELAISEKLGRQLEQEDAFLQLGNDEDAPEVHIGAYADQSRRIDAVVNEKWGEELGMIEGNALLIHTGRRSPQSVRPAIQKIVGQRASVQILGPDLDITAQQTAFLTGGSVADAVGSFNYRVLGGGRIAPNQGWVTANIRTEEVPLLGRMTCHKVMLPQLRAALREVAARGLGAKVYQTAGCYYPRFIAGTTQLSLHSFGIAIDINSLENGRGTVGQMDRSVVEIFKRWGFAWGGDWGYTDPMHFEMNRLVQAR